MLTETDIRAVAQRVVTESKGSALVDTGALKRSIAYTYIRGMVTFRQFVYGQYGDNSMLEENAIRLMPYGVQWRIVYTTFGGDEVEVGKTRQGRATHKSTVKYATKATTSRIRDLIAIKRRKRDGEAEE